MKVTHLAIPLLFSAPAWAIVGGVKASAEQAAVMVVGTRGAAPEGLLNLAKMLGASLDQQT